MICLKCKEIITGPICGKCDTNQEQYLFDNLESFELKEILEYILQSGQFAMDADILNSVFKDVLINFPQQLYIYNIILDDQLLNNIIDLKTREESVRFLNIKTEYLNNNYGLSEEVLYESLKYLLEAINNTKLEDEFESEKLKPKTTINISNTSLISKVIYSFFGLSLIVLLVIFGSKLLTSESKNEVRVDTIAPEIILNGEETIELYVGEKYQELGASVEDNIDNNLEVEITRLVDENNPGQYVVYYNVEDFAGNKASTKIRVVIVLEEKDIEPPVITLNGEKDVDILVGGTYLELGASVVDNRDTDLEVEITSDLDTNTPGTYIVYYNVNDEAGNRASSEFRVVNVIDNTQMPIIFLEKEKWDDESYKKTVVMNYIFKNQDIIIQSPKQININTVANGIIIRGENSGIHTYLPTLSEQGKILTLNINEEFFNGEVVRVYITDKLKDINNNSIDVTSYEFRVKSKDLVGDFTPNIITDTAKGVQAVHAVDLDNDGDIDILSASENDDTIAWYENNNQVFTKKIITDSADGARSVYAADFDNDGDMDILSASYEDNTIAWYENNNQVFTKEVITNSSDGTKVIHATDLDIDGDMDVLSINSDNTISWYENINQSFTKHKINDFYSRKSIYAADIDNDGDLDILSDLIWYKNINQTFTNYYIDYSIYAPSVESIYMVDIDNDGDLDILAVNDYSNNIFWYENKYMYKHLIFTKHIISSSNVNSSNKIDGGTNSVYAIDMDADGDMDVLTAEYRNIVWYENDNLVFSKNVLAYSALGGISMYSIDIDNDGDLDVLSASNSDNTITWYGETSYTLSLVDYDNTELSIERLSYNSTLNTVPVLKREGYSFTGWTDGTNTYAPDLNDFTMPKVNVELVAIYNK